MKTIRVPSAGGSYPVSVGRGLLGRVGDLLPLGGRKVLIVTDDGVPQEYARAVLAAASDGEIFTPLREKKPSLLPPSNFFFAVCSTRALPALPPSVRWGAAW